MSQDRTSKKQVSIGTRFGHLTVIEELPPVRRANQTYRSIKLACDCGNESVTRLANLTRKKRPVKSCGCLTPKRNSEAHKTHGMRLTKTYTIWQSILSRCSNSRAKDYHRYGGRGISVCSQWVNSFEAFFSDMGECPKGMSIERIDNNRGYAPWNCRWATPLEQAQNRRDNVLLTARGKTLCVAEWSRLSGIKEGTIRARISRGWSDVSAVTTPA